MSVKGSHEARCSVTITGDGELQLFHVPCGNPSLNSHRVAGMTASETAEVLFLSGSHRTQHLFQLSQVLQLVPVLVGTGKYCVHGIRDRPRKHDDRPLGRGATEHPHQTQRGKSTGTTQSLEGAHFEE